MRDVLADILSTLHLRSSIYCQSEINKSDWALQFELMRCAAFHIISQGTCWMTISGQAESVLLGEGDLVVLSCGQSHRLADSPRAPVCATIQLDDSNQESCLLMKWGDEQAGTTLVCGTFDFDTSADQSIFALLPDLIVFRASDHERMGLAHTIQALRDEANAQRPGRETLLTRLADMLLVLVLRAWLAEPDNRTQGWLGALGDPQITIALSCIHDAPEVSWTVEQLAMQAAMSRSAFAARFTSLVGEPPLSYLTHWRMQLATQLLSRSELTLMAVAAQVGYQSETAFSKAFRRERGTSPGQVRRARVEAQRTVKNKDRA